ncbi:hypothetical protein G9466_05745 [Halorussus sp. JP-T4]|nr:hypothetical protein [Halorussus sp. JP-T4]
MCSSALEWARNEGYAGWDPYDGLNSPLFDAEEMHWLSRLLALHGVQKSPVNLRRLLGVPRERNPKGVALFATAYLNRYETTGDDGHRLEAERLLDWLRENPSPYFDRYCWGYNFDWQNGRKFFLPAYYPSLVVSTFCARTFLRHYDVTGDSRSLSVVEDVCRFVAEEVNVETVDGHGVYAYSPLDSFVVVNANALASALFAETADRTGDRAWFERARKLVEFVCAMQADDGAWYYAVPATDSHLSHDNFHTGFVLESLERCRRAGIDGERVTATYQRGLRFYRNHLFDPDGAPRFEHDAPYPRDVHAAAQAVVTFVEDGSPESMALAADVVEWTNDNLYDDSGYFYRRVGRLLTDRTPYIRWSQAWMSYALSKYLAAGSADAGR